MAADLNYEYDENSVNEVVDEVAGSNNFIAFRKIRWQPDGEFRFDIRKYFIKADGSEFPGKGITFMSDKGPHLLAETLAANGFGNTDTMVSMLSARGDFTEAVARATKNNPNFAKELKMAYKNLEDEEDNKPLNAKEMLNQLL